MLDIECQASDFIIRYRNGSESNAVLWVTTQSETTVANIEPGQEPSIYPGVTGIAHAVIRAVEGSDTVQWDVLARTNGNATCDIDAEQTAQSSG